jgi:hypothetical protein
VRDALRRTLVYFGLVGDGDRAARRRRAAAAAVAVVVVLAFALTVSGLTVVGVLWTAAVFAVVGVLVALLRP